MSAQLASELREECGVFGIAAPGHKASFLTFDGLFALQHRGQEAAGMAVSDGEDILAIKDLGLVNQVFDERKLAFLQGHLAIGHTRYATTGSSSWHNAQPAFHNNETSSFALAHNGNVVNTAELAQQAGMSTETGISDSHIVAELVAQKADRLGSKATLADALAAVLPGVHGAFSMVVMNLTTLIGLRDPHGFHPLCLGRLDDGGWVVASETPALQIVGAKFIREIEPGEMVVIQNGMVESFHPFPPDEVEPRLCFFEFVYFARPDSMLYGKQTYTVRQRMGELLAKHAPPLPERDGIETVVIGVPDSGLPAAEGYARASGLPFSQGLVKNRYIGRTFITPEQEQRERGVLRKFSPLVDTIKGKRLVVVDDTIVRGTTHRAVVQMLREAGATEVHLRISAPPYKWPCFYGIDAGTHAELLAANLSHEEMCRYLHVDSLVFLPLSDVKQAVSVPGAGFCDACVTGDYPVPIPNPTRVS